MSAEHEQIKRLEEQLSEVEAKRYALREFMSAARAHKGDRFSWVANQELHGDYPGKELGLSVSFDGEVSFRDSAD